MNPNLKTGKILILNKKGGSGSKTGKSLILNKVLENSRNPMKRPMYA